MCVHTYIYIYIYTCVYTYVCMYVCIYIYIERERCICICICIYIYIYTYIYIYIYIHTRARPTGGVPQLPLAWRLGLRGPVLLVLPQAHVEREHRYRSYGDLVAISPTILSTTHLISTTNVDIHPLWAFSAPCYWCFRRSPPLYVCIYLYLSLCVYIYIYICICTYTYIYIYIYIYICIHIN